MVEFAVLAPVLVLLIFGVVEVGIALVALEEFDTAAAAALRQIRTGAVQQAGIPSTYAGASNCASASFTPGSNQNCLGINISASDTASTIFAKLLCANTFDGGAILNCDTSGTASSSMNWNITSYTSWSAFSGALPSLSYNKDGTPSTTFAPGTGSQIVVAMVGYKRPFYNPLVGCFFDASDCLAGKSPVLLLTYYAVFMAEPWGASS